MPNRIFPPVLPSVNYSFEYHSSSFYMGPSGANDYFMTILFEMPSMTVTSEIKHVQVSLRYLDTNVCAIKEGCSPDRSTLFISASGCDWTINPSGATEVPTNPYFRRTQVGSNIWELNIPFRIFDGGPHPGTNYSVQIRFGTDDLWNGAAGGAGDYGLTPYIGYGEFAGWRTKQTKAVPSNFGEWSNTTTIFCYERPGIIFSTNFNNFVPQICWTYEPKSDDPIAQVEMEYSYNDMMGKQTVSKQYSGTASNSNRFELTTYLDIAPFTLISGTIHALTQNNTKIDYEFVVNPIMIDVTEDHEKGFYTVWADGVVEDTVLTGEEINDGIIAKTLIAKGPISEDGDKTISVYRCNLVNLKTVKTVNKLNIIENQKSIIKDYTVEMGERYEYIFCIMDSENKLDEFFISPTPYGNTNPGYARLMSMEALYLTTKNHQLRCIGNLNVSNFKRNTTDGFQTTIGAQFPFYSRNSQNNYRTLSVSCAISINFDPTSVFMRLDPNNGLMWDEGVVTAYEKEHDGYPPEYFELQKQLIEAQNNFDAEREKVDTTNYYNDPNFHNEVNYNLTMYDAQIQNIKAKMEMYSPTRGSSELYIMNEDLYSDNAISLSRRRMKQRSSGGESIVQESAYEPYGMPELSTGDYTDADGNPHTSRFLRGAQSIYSPFLEYSDSIEYDTTNSDRMVYLERKFRDKVMSWLSDGMPKLLRSEHEGNLIVIITQPSFSPLSATGRKVWTVSFTATEIAEYNLENLIDYNLIPSVIENDYSETNPLAFHPGEVDPNVSMNLAWNSLNLYNVPNTQTGTAIEDIPLSLAIVNNIGTIAGGDLRIEFENKPSWLQTKVENGILYLTGTPAEGDISDPVTVTVTAIDDANPDASVNKAIGYITVGTVYNKIAINSLPSQGEMQVGDELTPINVADYTVGGVGVITWYASNLPLGFNIDMMTGVISGTAAEECPNGKTAIISARDEDGHVATQELVFDHIGPELYLAGQGLYSIPISEVGVPINEINLGPNASGGRPFLNGDEEYYKFSLTNAPEGITIDENTGVISGTPTVENDSATTMTVTATDSIGDSKSIDINVEQVLPAFLIQPYEYDPAHITVGGVRTYNFRMSSGGVTTPGAASVMDNIPVGDQPTDYWSWIINNPDGETLPDGSKADPSILGGMPFEEARDDGTIHKYYMLEGEGFLPNFKLDAITGKITGVPTVGWDQKQAIVRVKDRRGVYARDSRNGYPSYIIVTISKVISTMSVITIDPDGNPYSYRFPETCRDNKKRTITSAGGTENLEPMIPDDEYKVIFPLNRVVNAQVNNINDSYFRMEGFPAGFTGHYDAASNSYIIEKDPNQTLAPAVGRTAYLYFHDDTKNENGDYQTVSIPIYVGTIYERLNWADDYNISVSFVGDTLNKMFSGLVGGKPPYQFSLASGQYLPPGILLANPQATHFGISGFKGTFTNLMNKSRTVAVTLKDALGQQLRVSFTFGAVYYHLSVKLNNATDASGTNLFNRMSNYNFLIGVTNIPQTGNILQPIIVSGGSGEANYRYEIIGESANNILGGLKFVDGKNGIVAGSVTTEVKTNINLRSKLKITDNITKEVYILDFELLTARCWKQPDNKGGATVTVTGLTYRQNIDSSKYMWLIDPLGNTSVESFSTNLPSGIMFNDENSYELSGAPTVTGTPGQAIIGVRTEENPWTPAKEYTRPVNFGSIAGSIKIAFSGVSIPALGVGDTIGTRDSSGNIVPIVISTGQGGTGGSFGGGTAPYRWEIDKWENENGVEMTSGIPGFRLSPNSNGTSCTIGGTATSQFPQRGRVYIRVYDNNNDSDYLVLEFAGVYPKLNITNGTINIPAAYSGIPITPITINTSGGYGSISFILNGGDVYGYSIGGTNKNQIVGPTTLSSVPAGTGKLTAIDSVGQRAIVNVNFGAVMGQLSFDDSQVNLNIPSGKVNSTFSLDLSPGIVGGKAPQTWTLGTIPTGWNISISSTGLLSGTRPSLPTGATTVQVTIDDDTTETGVKIIISLGAVIE